LSTKVIKGQKVDLTRMHPNLQLISLIIGWSNNSSMELDCSAFLLQQNGKVHGDDGLIFYGNPRNSFVEYSDKGDTEKRLIIKVPKISSNIDKIAISLTIYEGEQRRQSFGQVRGAYLAIVNENNHELIRHNLDHSFSVETSIVIGELYRYNGDWKYNAIAAGYSGGLNALCQHYGVDVSTNDVKPQPKPNPPPVPPTPPPTPINLRKIELTKKGEKITLEKKSGGQGEILINLNWNKKIKQKVFGICLALILIWI
jgi:tellurite resistance protein TerA